MLNDRCVCDGRIESSTTFSQVGIQCPPDPSQDEKFNHKRGDVLRQSLDFRSSLKRLAIENLGAIALALAEFRQRLRPRDVPEESARQLVELLRGLQLQVTAEFEKTHKQLTESQGEHRAQLRWFAQFFLDQQPRVFPGRSTPPPSADPALQQLSVDQEHIFELQQIALAEYAQYCGLSSQIKSAVHSIYEQRTNLFWLLDSLLQNAENLKKDVAYNVDETFRPIEERIGHRNSIFKQQLLYPIPHRCRPVITSVYRSPSYYSSYYSPFKYL